MKILFDNDAFIKLAMADLLGESIDLLGGSLSQCVRLASLPFMLRKNKLRSRYGEAIADKVLKLAEKVPALSPVQSRWEDALLETHEIDPGEAILFASAAEQNCIVVTGDKRALRALKSVDGILECLNNKFVSIEGLLIALCSKFGNEEVHERTQDLSQHDVAVGVCFTKNDIDPIPKLKVYLDELKRDVDPLQLRDLTVERGQN